MSLEFGVFGLILLLLALPFVRRADALSPVRMFLYGWLVCFASLASNMVVYDQPMTLLTAGVLGATLILFVAGAWCGRERTLASIRPAGFDTRSIVERTAMLAVAVLSLGALAYILDDLTVGTGQLLWGSFAESLQLIRTEKWDGLFAGEASVAPLRSVCITASLIMATATPALFRSRRWLLCGVGCLAVVVLALESLLEGARFTLGVMFMSVLVSAAVTGRGGRRTRVFTTPRVLVGAAMAVYFFIVFPTQRNPDLVNGLDRQLAWLGAAHFSPWVGDVSEHAGFGWVGVFAYATSYFSHGIDKLNFFLSETDVPSWYALGLYNVPQISQVTAVFSDGVTPWHQVRLDIAGVMARQGWSLNPWATGIRDFAIDVGLVGTVLAAFVLGMASQRIYERATAGGSYFTLVLACYMSVGALTFAFHSPLQIRVLSNGLWLLGAIVLCCGLARGSVRGSRQTLREPPWRLRDGRAAGPSPARPVAACASPGNGV